MKNKLPVTDTSAKVLPASPKMDEQEKKWRTEDALRTIEKAEEHKRDKGLMKEVRSMAKSKMKNLGKIC